MELMEQGVGVREDSSAPQAGWEGGFLSPPGPRTQLWPGHKYQECCSPSPREDTSNHGFLSCPLRSMLCP